LRLLLPVSAVRANYSDSNERVISVKITNVTFGFWRLTGGGAAFKGNVEILGTKKPGQGETLPPGPAAELL
jgi:hypothetical protein